MTRDRALYLASLVNLTASEAAELMRTSRDEVYRLVRTGELRCTRFGKRLVFTRSELDRFMARGDAHDLTPMPPEVRRRLGNAAS